MRISLEDLGYAVRQLRRSPGLTILVVLTLALGIGASTAMFSVENGFHRPLPVRAPGQIVVLATESKGDAVGLEGIEYRFSYPALADFRKQAEAFSDLFAYNMGRGGLTAGGKASQFFYSYVTGNYFSVLGIKPAAGRFFLLGEGEKPGADILLVLGYSCWQKRFGGDAGVIGRRVRVDGKAATVVGVAPKEFRGVYWNTEMDGYVPLNYMTQQGSWALRRDVQRSPPAAVDRAGEAEGRGEPGAGAELGRCHCAAGGGAAGIWRALRASRADVSIVLHEGGRSDSGGTGRGS